jgi:hypothetical protein
MNKVFNINRFARLFIKHTAEHYKSYLMSLIVLIGVMVLGGSFLVYMIPGSMDMGMQSALFGSILLLAGTIFTSTIFSDYGEKKKSIAAFSLPATHFEKYFLAWLYSFALFLLIYTGSFYLILIFLLHLKPVPGHPVEIYNVFNNQLGYLMIILFALLHSIAFYGAIFYSKLHFIKTAFVFFLCFAGLILINKIFLGLLLQQEVRPSMPFGNIRLVDSNKEIIIQLRQPDHDPVLWIMIAITLLFWIATYFRLKEKQA